MEGHARPESQARPEVQVIHSLATLLAHVRAQEDGRQHRSVIVDIELPNGDYEEFNVDLTAEDSACPWEAQSTDAPDALREKAMRAAERKVNR